MINEVTSFSVTVTVAICMKQTKILYGQLNNCSVNLPTFRLDALVILLIAALPYHTCPFLFTSS